MSAKEVTSRCMRNVQNAACQNNLQSWSHNLNIGLLRPVYCNREVLPICFSVNRWQGQMVDKRGMRWTAISICCVLFFDRVFYLFRVLTRLNWFGCIAAIRYCTSASNVYCQSVRKCKNQLACYASWYDNSMYSLI